MIILITKEQYQKILENPLLDVNKGKFIMIEKHDDVEKWMCLDNVSGSAYQTVAKNIVDVVKWFQGILS